MTVETTTSKAGPYAGAGTVGPFPVPFRFLDASHLQVTRTDASGVNTVLELGADYSVQGVGQNTGAVTLLAPLAVGFKLTVLRNVPATQEADYVQNDAFPAESHERALDKLTMLVQQQGEMVGRALVVPATDASVSMVLPSVASRARRYLSFDESGRPVSTTFDVDAVAQASQAAQDAAVNAKNSEIAAAGSAEDAEASADFAREQSGFVAQQVAATTPTVVRFSGDGAATTFGLPSVPGAEENTLVYISGVYQQKNTYQVPAGTSSLIFSEAPPVGTQNIEVVIAPSAMLQIGDAQDISFVGPDGIKRSVGNYLKNGLSFASLKFPNLAAAESAAAGLPDGQSVSVEDEQKRYIVDDGVLVPSGNFVRADLALRGGSGLVGWFQSGLGAIFRWVQDKLRESVSVDDFDAKGDGIADDSDAFVKACASLGPKGGVVHYYRKHLIDSSFTVPPGVILKGPKPFLGTNGVHGVTSPYGEMPALIISSAVTITLGASAGIADMLYYRKGMVFPAANAAEFSGIPFVAGGDDVSISRSMALGFTKAYYSNGFQRPRIVDFFHDNMNGIEITQCLDVPFLTRCHAWPFATIAHPSKPADWAWRETAYHLHDTVDWGKLTDCFAYGYRKSFHINNANSTTMHSCGADGTFSGGVPTHPDSIGFVIEGDSSDTRLMVPQSSAQGQFCVRVNTLAGRLTKILGGDLWSTNGVGKGAICVDGGDVKVGCAMRNHTNGVIVNNAASIVEILDESRFDNIAQMVNCTVPTNKVFIKNPGFAASIPAGRQVVVGSLTAAMVPSAAAVALPMNGDTFHITGNTPFGTLYGGYLGREVVLIFDAANTVYNGTASTTSMKLLGGANYAPGVNSTLTLKHDGKQWFEIGRS